MEQPHIKQVQEHGCHGGTDGVESCPRMKWEFSEISNEIRPTGVTDQAASRVD